MICRVFGTLEFETSSDQSRIRTSFHWTTRRLLKFLSDSLIFYVAQILCNDKKERQFWKLEKPYKFASNSFLLFNENQLTIELTREKEGEKFVVVCDDLLCVIEWTLKHAKTSFVYDFSMINLQFTTLFCGGGEFCVFVVFPQNHLTFLESLKNSQQSLHQTAMECLRLFLLSFTICSEGKRKKHHHHHPHTVQTNLKAPNVCVEQTLYVSFFLFFGLVRWTSLARLSMKIECFAVVGALVFFFFSVSLLRMPHNESSFRSRSSQSSAVFVMFDYMWNTTSEREKVCGWDFRMEPKRWDTCGIFSTQTWNFTNFW